MRARARARERAPRRSLTGPGAADNIGAHAPGPAGRGDGPPCMNYPLFIAERYLLARRKQAIIYVISLVSVLGVIV